MQAGSRASERETPRPSRGRPAHHPRRLPSPAPCAGARGGERNARRATGREHEPAATGRTDARGGERAGPGNAPTPERGPEAASSRRREDGRRGTGEGRGEERGTGEESGGRRGRHGGVVEKTRRSPTDRRALLHPAPPSTPDRPSDSLPPLTLSLSLTRSLSRRQGPTPRPPRSRETPPPRRATDAVRPGPPTHTRPPRARERARSAARPQPGGKRAAAGDAAASRGSPPGHASPGRGRARTTRPRPEPPAPTRRGEAAGAGTDPGRAARGAVEEAGRTSVAGTPPPPGAGGERRRNGRGPATPPPRAPAARARDRPRPPTPRGYAQRPLAARGRFPKGTDRGGQRPGARGQGPRRELSLPSLPSHGQRAPPVASARGGGGAPRLHLGGQRAPAALRGNPQPRHPGKARARAHTHATHARTPPGGD